jgi:hypothetical protein
MSTPSDPKTDSKNATTPAAASTSAAPGVSLEQQRRLNRDEAPTG